MNRQFLTCLRIGVLLALTVALPAPVAANRLPNIVFILLAGFVATAGFLGY